VDRKRERESSGRGEGALDTWVEEILLVTVGMAQSCSFWVELWAVYDTPRQRPHYKGLQGQKE
jgi:hypothetical protein